MIDASMVCVPKHLSVAHREYLFVPTQSSCGPSASGELSPLRRCCFYEVRQRSHVCRAEAGVVSAERRLVYGERHPEPRGV